jgi:hypothetical protein
MLFVWMADPNKIIAAVKRGYQALESIHSAQLSGCAKGNVHVPLSISARGRKRRTV